MRRFLDRLYQLSGYAAAGFLVLICLTVATQVTFRLIDAIAFRLTGERYGLLVPSAAEFSGFFLAAASFLALAHTLRHGEHIRVNLLLRNLNGRARRAVELSAGAVGLLISGFFSWHTLLMVIDSWQFGEVSFGIVPVPLWIPQAAMLAGLVILTIAFADGFIAILRGRTPLWADGEA
ncbi:MAG TPA: TRAP transporter small permease [Thermopetrobacter sp.]|nr:TRAP transporter small permease [Thermopetrobacter sp.]